MTGALDTRMRATAERLISKFGKSVTWKSDSSSYDKTTGKATAGSTDYTVTITPPEPFDSALVDGVTILAGDVRVMLAASDITFTPKVRDRVVIDGETFQVVSASKVYSGSLAAAWEFQCRK